MSKDKPLAVLIIGAPGSGKTHLAQKAYQPLGFVLFDDPKPGDTFLIEKYTGRNIVITDPFLCDSKIRELCIQFLEKKGWEVSCVYFENNPEKCEKLLKWRKRNDNSRITGYRVWNYEIPDGAETLLIWTPPESA